MFKKYYFDNAATTKTRPEVVRVMKRYFRNRYGNPSAIHKSGLVAKGTIEMCREKIAAILGCEGNELIFTGSGSEANNTAIHSATKTSVDKRHVISSRIEHSSIYQPLQTLKDAGYLITFIDVDKNGRYDLEQLSNAIRPDTSLISLSVANNEIGTIQDTRQLKTIVDRHNVRLHLDAVQALPYMTLNLKTLGADYVSFSGHKLYAPKGIGLLYIRDGAPAWPLIEGGGQEMERRSGTENVPYIAALTKAIELNDKEKSKVNASIQAKRDSIVNYVLAHIPGAILTGDPTDRVPAIASFAFSDVSGKAMVRKLAAQNIELSSGSACSSRKHLPSRILEAIDVGNTFINGGIRISVGKYNSAKEVKVLLRALDVGIRELRATGSKPELDSGFISQPAFRKLIQNKTDVQVVDLRLKNVPALPMKGVLPVPFWKLKSAAKKLTRHHPVILVCYDGDVLGPNAQSLLIGKGFKDVSVLSGGYHAFAAHESSGIAITGQ